MKLPNRNLACSINNLLFLLKRTVLEIFIKFKAKKANVVGVFVVCQAFNLFFELLSSACCEDFKRNAMLEGDFLL